MLFNSIQFALFLSIVFAIYWLLRKNLRLQNLFVVVASYIFYGWWDYRFLFLIALTSFLSWGSGLLISRETGKNEEVRGKNDEVRGKHKAKWYLAGNITINLLILGVFKYFNFFVDSFCDLFGLENSIAIKVILPVGISFYTFQALSYSIDAYRVNIKPTKDIVAFFAYVSFFPQLVSGPIERATNLLPQFEKPRVFNYDAAVDGCRRILWGLFKKMVIADNCAVYVDQVWEQFSNQHSAISSSTLVLAAVLFAFQIYGDFSGYSDIAIGTAKLFGIRLMENFNQPYLSRTMGDFWRRWHISLTTWLRDYVYIPMGGSHHGIGRTIFNTMSVFALCGLWHGAAWTFVLWGLYNGVGVLLSRYTKRGSVLLTFVLVTIGWILFRAPSVSAAGEYLKGLCSASLFSLPMMPYPVVMAVTMLSIVGMLVAEYKQWKPSRWWSIYPMIMLIWWFCHETNQFIYFQF